jgi:hypothetical protein
MGIAAHVIGLRIVHCEMGIDEMPTNLTPILGLNCYVRIKEGLRWRGMRCAQPYSTTPNI